MRRLRWALLATLALAALALAAPFLVSLKPLAPQIAELAAMRLGHPVRLDDLRLSLWPTPGATAQGVRIGKAGEIAIATVRLELDPRTLFDDKLTIRQVHARRAALNRAGIDIIRGVLRRSSEAPRRADGESGVRLKRVVIEDIALELPGLQLPPFDLDLHLAPSAPRWHTVFTARDGNVRLVMAPREAEGIALEVQATDWRVPVPSIDLRFAAFAAQGTLRAGRLAFHRVRAALYGGQVAGEATLGWGARWDVHAALDFHEVDVARLQRAFKRPPKLTGRLTARALMRSRAKRAGALVDGLALDAPFRIAHGAFGGVDLSQAAAVSGDAIVGGETTFDEFTGKLSVRGRARRVDELCARSSALVAGGNVQVDARERLSGRLDVSLANTAGLVRVPVRLSGTPSDPVATPSQLMSVGAVIGTLLLPGVGTALGASAANLLEGSVGCT